MTEQAVYIVAAKRPAATKKVKRSGFVKNLLDDLLVDILKETVKRIKCKPYEDICDTLIG